MMGYGGLSTTLSNVELGADSKTTKGAQATVLICRTQTDRVSIAAGIPLTWCTNTSSLVSFLLGGRKNKLTIKGSKHSERLQRTNVLTEISRPKTHNLLSSLSFQNRCLEPIP